MSGAKLDTNWVELRCKRVRVDFLIGLNAHFAVKRLIDEVLSCNEYLVLHCIAETIDNLGLLVSLIVHCLFDLSYQESARVEAEVRGDHFYNEK